MTTQELKQQIDKVLGNSIRCLLPSYWWKKVFGAVIDSVGEKLDSKSIKTINGESIVGEGDLRVGVKSVESVDTLEKLNAKVGDIVTVGVKSESIAVKVSDCHLIQSTDNLSSEWDKCTIIKGIEETNEIESSSFNVLYLCASSESLIKDTVSIGWEHSARIYLHFVDGNDKTISLSEVNDLLASGNYRLAICSVTDGFDYYYTFYTEVAKDTADAYIKGETWEKLAKESDIQGGESSEVIAIYEGETSQRNADAYNKIKACHEKGLPINAVVVKDGMSYAASVGFTDFLNTGTYVAIAEFVRTTDAVIKTVSVMLGLVQDTGEGVASKFAEVEAGDEPIEFLYLRLQNPDSTKEHNAKVFQKMNNSFVRVLFNDASASENGNEILCATYGCSYVKIEDYFIVQLEESFSSRVFKLTSDGTLTFEYRNTHADSELSETSTNAVQNKVVTEALNNKVDKVNGKQLSTEDFTSALKTKLENLNAFDPTEINNKVDGLQNQLNTLVSGDASVAIESFNDITAFLEGIEDSESLNSIIASIEQQIAGKQDKLVSGTNIKTINGESILGEGNIVVNVDTSNLATKEELNTKQDVISDLETIRSGAARGATALQEHQDISHLATKEEVTNLQNEVITNEEVSAAAFNEINERIEQLSENVSGAAATKEELNNAVETINNTIIENEEITATALTDLDARIKEIIARLDVIEGNN